MVQIWEYFLAYSTITSRQGGASCYQIVLHKVCLYISLTRILMRSIVSTVFRHSTASKSPGSVAQAGLKPSRNISSLDGLRRVVPIQSQPSWHFISYFSFGVFRLSKTSNGRFPTHGRPLT